MPVAGWQPGDHYADITVTVWAEFSRLATTLW